MARVVLGVLVLLGALRIGPTCAAVVAPACRTVVQMIAPCVAFLADRALAPYGPCCNGVTALNRTALTYEARVGICSCLKGITPRLPIVDYGRAAALPRMCGVNINVTISPSTDCYSVPWP